MVIKLNVRKANANTSVLQNTSSLKAPAFWPEPPAPYPVGVEKWEAISIAIECPSESPEYLAFECCLKALCAITLSADQLLASISSSQIATECELSIKYEGSSLSREVSFQDSGSLPPNLKRDLGASSYIASELGTLEELDKSIVQETITILNAEPLVLDNEESNNKESSSDESKDSDSDIESEKVLRRYGGFPIVQEMSTHIDVARQAKVIEEEY